MFAFKVSINLKQQLADDNFESMAPSILQQKVNNICKRMSKMLLWRHCVFCIQLVNGSPHNNFKIKQEKAEGCYERESHSVKLFVSSFLSEISSIQRSVGLDDGDIKVFQFASKQINLRAGQSQGHLWSKLLIIKLRVLVEGKGNGLNSQSNVEATTMSQIWLKRRHLHFYLSSVH